MPFASLHQVQFSPAGSTRLVAETFGQHGVAPVREHDLLRRPLTTDVLCAPDDLAVVALPVYSGRLPELCLASLAHFKGQGTLAVAVVVYGNRAYDDALLELCDLLNANGFTLLGAAAVVARHSIFPSIAADRPHAEDKRRLDAFMARCLDKANTRDPQKPFAPLNIPGNRPYKDPKAPSVRPSVGTDCRQCGACTRICPTGALTIVGKTLVKNEALCIACTACLKACPSGAQGFHGEGYEPMCQMFTTHFSGPREPEFFI